MKSLLLTLFYISVTLVNAQVKLNDLEQNFVKKTKKNQSGIISTLNGKRYTGQIESFEKVNNELTTFEFKKGILLSHTRTRHDSVFYKTTFKAGLMHITDQPYWRTNVNQSSISYLSNNKVDSIHWFLNGELLAKIYYTYPEPNIKLEKFYHCLNQSPVLNYECQHQYDCGDQSSAELQYYPCGIQSLLFGKEIYYNPITGEKTKIITHAIIDGKSTVLSVEEIEK